MNELEQHTYLDNLDNEEIKQRKYCVFLVAPNPTLRTVLSAQLCHEGLTIFSFSSLDEIPFYEHTPIGCPKSADLLLLQQPRDGQSVQDLIGKARQMDMLSATPIVMVSEDRHYSTLMTSVTYGAMDYILMPTTRKELVRHVSRVLGIQRSRLGLDDDIFIRDLHPALDRELKRSSRSKAPFSIVIGHLQFGHETPLDIAEEESPEVEEVNLRLTTVYQSYLESLCRALRQTDMIASFGLREFLLILPFTTKEGVEMVVEKLEGNFIKILNTVNNHLSVTLKLGASTYPDDAEDKAGLIGIAHKMTEI